VAGLEAEIDKAKPSAGDVAAAGHPCFMLGELAAKIKGEIPKELASSEQMAEAFKALEQATAAMQQILLAAPAPRPGVAAASSVEAPRQPAATGAERQNGDDEEDEDVGMGDVEGFAAALEGALGQDISDEAKKRACEAARIWAERKKPRV